MGLLTDEDRRKYNEERPTHWKQARLHRICEIRGESFWEYSRTRSKNALRKYEEMTALLDRLITPTARAKNGGKNVRTPR